MALPDTVFDGNFETPIEIEGGPIFLTDDVTQALMITRQYVVKADNYVPLPQGTVDAFYKDAYLVQENPGSRQGPLFYFSRLYVQLPEERIEPRSVSFTVLGQSKADFSSVTLLPIAWNQYGAAAPATRNVVGQSTFTYSLDPNSFPKPPITRNTYNGNPVDFMGYVYDYQGNVKVSDELTEPRWDLVGSTFYTLMPAVWVQEVNITRWRGPIWQMEVVRVYAPYA
jgi:hypothetical protein